MACTKLSAPIVIYNPEAAILGLRAPWDIPIEDFGFGFAMVTLAILLWRRWLDGRPLPERPKMRPEPLDKVRRAPVEGCIPALLDKLRSLDVPLRSIRGGHEPARAPFTVE
jgi:hypothetical protein